MTGSGLMIHEMKNVERVEEKAETVVAHGKDLVLRCLQQDPDQYIFSFKEHSLTLYTY